MYEALKKPQYFIKITSIFDSSSKIMMPKNIEKNVSSENLRSGNSASKIPSLQIVSSELVQKVLKNFSPKKSNERPP